MRVALARSLRFLLVMRRMALAVGAAIAVIAAVASRILKVAYLALTYARIGQCPRAFHDALVIGRVAGRGLHVIIARFHFHLAFGATVRVGTRNAQPRALVP